MSNKGTGAVHVASGFGSCPFSHFYMSPELFPFQFEGDKGSYLFPLFIVPTAHCQPLQQTAVMVGLNKAATHASVLRK